MVEHKEVFCSKCGCHTFEYDRSWKEYSCKDCGWLIEDGKKISLLNEIRNSEVTRKIVPQAASGLFAFVDRASMNALRGDDRCPVVFNKPMDITRNSPGQKCR